MLASGQTRGMHPISRRTFLASAAAIAVAACSDGGDDNAADVSTSTPSTPASEAASPPAPDEADAEAEACGGGGCSSPQAPNSALAKSRPNTVTGAIAERRGTRGTD